VQRGKESTSLPKALPLVLARSFARGHFSLEVGRRLVVGHDDEDVGLLPRFAAPPGGGALAGPFDWRGRQDASARWKDWASCLRSRSLVPRPSRHEDNRSVVHCVTAFVSSGENPPRNANFGSRTARGRREGASSVRRRPLLIR